MTVFENVAFGLRLKKVSGQDIKKRVDEVLNLVNMASFSERRPETLSGGQAQRVALARALVNEPDCVLLDEPLGALDQKLREHMQTELRLLQRRLGLTFIFVTHDQEEAMLLSDRIAVMNDGHVEQVSEPRALYEIPQSIFCARFVGRRNEFDGYVLDRDGDLISVQVGARQRLKGRSVCQALDSEGGGLIRAFVRPEVLRPVPRTASPTPGYNVIEGEVVQILFRGLKLEVAIGVGGDQIMRSLLDVDPETMSLRVGDRLGFEFSPSETHLFLSRAQ